MDETSAAATDGLRERKKRATRAAIAQAAADLFSERGFDAVSTQDVAAAAQVSRQTLFNYFPSKEDLLFDRDPEIREALLAAVRERTPGTSVLEAFRGHTRSFWTRLRDLLAQGPLGHGFWAIVQSSPALQDHAEVLFARHARAAAAALARERGAPEDDPMCQAIARALCGVNAGLLVTGMGRITEAPPAERAAVADEIIAAAEQAYDLLRDGLTGV